MKLIKSNEELINPDWGKFKNFKKVKNEEAAIRADWINQIAKLVSKPYPQMASLLYGLPTKWLHQMYDDACAFKKNPPARFWQLLKETKK